jgi:predicted CXXCH cytochrome family protein
MDILRNRSLLLSLGLFVAVCVLGGRAGADTPNSCLDCHSGLDAPLKVTAEQFAQDIHSQKGLTCVSCHGGDPTKDDPDAMSESAGFKTFTKKDIPALCSKCHSDVAFMRKYNPSLRTDQYSQYQTSVHGKLLAKGDLKVAVCIDCHSVHDIRAPKDTRSTVHPLNVPKTCARCHADAAYMKDHKIPTDQYAGYTDSVHYKALTVRGDLSAPTCVTCHGNHGAAPPGVDTVQNVCSTCHVFQAQLFESSAHKEAFKAASLGGCITCHSNHRIAHPDDTLLGTGNKSVCTNCHSDGDPGFKAAGEMRAQIDKLDTSLKSAKELLDKAEDSGMEVSEARTAEDQARDALTKARVTIHSLQPAKVGQDIEAGIKVSEKAQQAGTAALAERDYRRKGLGFSLIAIFIMVVALGLYIRQLEGKQA